MKTVLVIGAARSGVAVTQTLLNRGYQVILTDTQEPEKIVKSFPMIKEALNALPNERVIKIFGQQLAVDFIEKIDWIVVSPGVPLTIPIIQAAFERGIPVRSEVEQAYLLTKTPFLAITGTNGKTTTTTLVGEIFEHSGRKTFTVGNIGDPISNYVDEALEEDVFVTEIGSFQLLTCHEFHPRGAAILNLSPDHLDRHKTIENYYQAKARIFMNQNENDFLVLNADDENVCRIAEKAVSKKIWFSLKEEVPLGAFIRDQEIIIRDTTDISICSIEELGIKGPHNVMNAMAAACMAYFTGVEISVIRETLISFKGVEHRQERFAEINGIAYINDSKGTNTDATITALRAMTGPTILLAGGYDKKEDYTAMIQEAKKHVKKMILIGVTAENIAECALENGFEAIEHAENFEEAVKRAINQAEKGDTVLLSPACASWDMFDNFEIRGKYFKALVEKYGGKEK